MAQNPIQWFPGHMAKTRRIIKECLSQVDVVIELLDSRIPYSSRNPETKKIIGSKPLITLLAKATLADPQKSKKWVEYYNANGSTAILIDSVTGLGMADFTKAVNILLAEKIERYENKGMSGRKLKAMVLGVPNVGKSSLINKISKSKKAKVENRPGVTLDKQWVSTDIGIDLLDMPGVLWPKFEDRRIGENLAMTGAVKDSILDIETLGMALCGRLRELYPELLCSRYKLATIPDTDNYDLMCAIGRKRGFLVSGGEIDTERTANMLIDELRAGKIGRITLDKI
jgi:ribosome biogenesis GTPase A